MGHGANISVIDSNSPTWDNVITGQVNLYDAIRRQVDFKLNGKDYKLRTDRALPTLIVRYVPRSLPHHHRHYPTLMNIITNIL